MKHFRTPTVYDADGLTEEDRAAIARDKAADRPRGELNAFGYCSDCGLGPFSPGTYYCPACDREDW